MPTLPADLTDDALTGTYRVWQRRRGHRYSLDDCVTAWDASRAVSSPRRALDLGCGIGSVLLMLAYKHPRARFTAVEAQAESHALATHNVARNGLTERVQLHRGDLRDAALIDRLESGYDLISGTPPYQPVGRGTISPDSQRAHARVELRGGIEDYVQAAARLLAASGRFVVCGDARAPQRLYGSAARAGLQVLQERRVWPAARYKRPLFCVWTLARRAAPGLPDQLCRVEQFVARDARGARTEDAYALRAFFDLSLDPSEKQSPRVRHRSQTASGVQAHGRA